MNVFLKKDDRDIANRLGTALEDLDNNQKELMFYGEYLDEEALELLESKPGPQYPYCID